MKRVAISVEGQTEERFVKNILQPYFLTNEIYLEPKILVNKRVLDGPDFKGGICKLNKAVKEIKYLLRCFDYVTTFYDLYGLHESFLPEDISSIIDPYNKTQAIEKHLAHVIDNYKFIPYIQLHEFEAFLFIDAEITADSFLDCNKTFVQAEIEKVLSDCNNNPELINDSTITAPSKRIINMYRSYQKVTDTLSVCNKIGLNKIKNACPHFSEWINKLNNL